VAVSETRQGGHALLTAGGGGGVLALRVVLELARMGASTPWLRIATLTAGVLQVVGILVFFHTMWSRIRPVGSQAREAQGERF
jgi:hypothetical protein